MDIGFSQLLLINHYSLADSHGECWCPVQTRPPPHTRSTSSLNRGGGGGTGSGGRPGRTAVLPLWQREGQDRGQRREQQTMQTRFQISTFNCSLHPFPFFVL